MKRVLIITECRKYRINYGETLQAVSLNRVVTSMGFDCITAAFEFPQNDIKWLLDHKEFISRAIKGERFRRKFIKKGVVRGENKAFFTSLVKKADIVICGSDVIWYVKDYNSTYLLNFPGINIRKIAYAPSLRDYRIEDVCYKNKLARWAKDIDYLSTREKKGSDIITELTGRSVETVLDPTLLIKKREWDLMSSKRLFKSHYILIYVIGKTSLFEDQIKMFLKEFKEYNLIWIRMENNDGYFCGKSLLNVGPAEFISLIRYSDAVITDSFHGFAFSVIYQKMVYALKRVIDKDDLYDFDCRISNLINMLNLESIIQVQKNTEYGLFDTKNCKNNLDKERRKSLNFLKRALEDDEEGDFE